MDDDEPSVLRPCDACLWHFHAHCQGADVFCVCLDCPWLYEETP